VERGREHAEAVDDPPLCRRQERIRPVDRRTQRLVALHGGAPSTRQEAEPFVEHACQVGWRERDDACGRQLDGEWDAVESPADVCDVTKVVADLELGKYGARPLDQALP